MAIAGQKEIAAMLKEYFQVLMKIMIFTEGTIVMHKNAVGHSREEIVKQSIEREPSVKDYAQYVPIGNAMKKIQSWSDQGIEVIYLTPRKQKKEIEDIQNVLDRYNFPRGTLEFRRNEEHYKDVAERVIPDILLKDDCESLGGVKEMTYTHIQPKTKKKIKLIAIQEFGGIDHLSDDIEQFMVVNNKTFRIF